MTPSTARIETELIKLLGGFVQRLSTEATVDPSDIKFHEIIRELCVKAPKAAQAIAQAIRDVQESDACQEPAAEEASSVPLKGQKRKSNDSLTSTRLAKRKAGGSPADQRHLSKDTSYEEPVVSSVFGESPSAMVWKETPLSLMNSLARNTA
ncbi:hypothetical protein BJY01DRAFT_246894 [Aspergillus pseudoustus]|uniref:Uncharacterized protein n=1 Tax=Aspergillus pseudoustus TaxID=1810923 RepID=A0ABR4K665_9EURO